MKKKHTAQSGFFNLCILLGFIGFFAGIAVPLAQQSAGKRSTSEGTTQFPATSSDSGREAGVFLTQEFPTGGVLWDQYNNAATQAPINIGSQDFEPAMAAFNDQADDDFVFPSPPP